jgi:hypothetical protein
LVRHGGFSVDVGLVGGISSSGSHTGPSRSIINAKGAQAPASNVSVQ